MVVDIALCSKARHIISQCLSPTRCQLGLSEFNAGQGLKKVPSVRPDDWAFLLRK